MNELGRFCEWAIYINRGLIIRCCMDSFDEVEHRRLRRHIFSWLRDSGWIVLLFNWPTYNKIWKSSERKEGRFLSLYSSVYRFATWPIGNQCGLHDSSLIIWFGCTQGKLYQVAAWFVSFCIPRSLQTISYSEIAIRNLGQWLIHDFSPFSNKILKSWLDFFTYLLKWPLLLVENKSVYYILTT